MSALGQKRKRGVCTRPHNAIDLITSSFVPSMRYAEESLPSHFALGPHLVEPLRWRQNLRFPIWGGKMIHTQRTQETEAEKLERLQREREEMRLAIASYTGPVTKCPTGKSTSDPYGLGKHRRPARTRARNGDGR